MFRIATYIFLTRITHIKKSIAESNQNKNVFDVFSNGGGPQCRYVFFPSSVIPIFAADIKIDHTGIWNGKPWADNKIIWYVGWKPFFFFFFLTFFNKTIGFETKKKKKIKNHLDIRYRFMPILATNIYAYLLRFSRRAPHNTAH